MRLLVSVANAAEASAALAGGADFIDAKDPAAGALGAVSREVFRDIHACVSGERPVTAALGDAAGEDEIERAARAFAAAGARLVKVGFAGIAGADRVGALTAAAVRGAAGRRRGPCGVVAVAYADSDRAGASRPRISWMWRRAAAPRACCSTPRIKRAPGCAIWSRPARSRHWSPGVHARGLFVALAGQLTAGDLPFVRDTGADIAGVRGAACDAGRMGHVSADRVRLLQCSAAFQPEVGGLLTGPPYFRAVPTV